MQVTVMSCRTAHACAWPMAIPWMGERAGGASLGPASDASIPLSTSGSVSQLSPADGRTQLAVPPERQQT